MTRQWEQVRLKYVAACNVRTLPENTPADREFAYVDVSNVTQGQMTIPSELIRFGDAPSRARRLAEPGDSVVSTVRTYLRAVATVPEAAEDLVFSTAFAVLSPSEAVDDRFLAWYLQGDEFVSRIESRSVGVSYPAITSTELMTMGLKLPSLHIQRAIADYLDRETAQIDSLIEAQQRLVSLQTERRKAVLDRLSTEVVGPAVRLKYLFRRVSESNHPAEQVLSVYRDFGVVPKASRRDNYNQTPENVDRYLLVRPGDLVINRMKAWQGSLGISEHRGIVSGDYEVVTPCSDALLPRFAHLYLRSPRMIAEYAVRSTGIRPSQWRLYWDEMGSIEMPTPPLHEQARLVADIETTLKRLDALVEGAERLSLLAHERRAALITAAVTGQIHVGATA